MSLNKVMLIGHVGKEPDIRTLEGGAKVGSFSFATTDKGYTLANGTQVPERTEWHNIIVWNKTAEVVEKYVHKGDKLYLEGKIRTRNYDDKNGIKHFITEVFVDYMDMLILKQQPGASASIPVQQPLPNNQAPNRQTVDQQPSFQNVPLPGDDLPF